MNEDGTLDRDQMKKVGKLNTYLRDTCGVPMKDSFRIAMIIVQNWEAIKNTIDGEGENDD